MKTEHEKSYPIHFNFSTINEEAKCFLVVCPVNVKAGRGSSREKILKCVVILSGRSLCSTDKINFRSFITVSSALEVPTTNQSYLPYLLQPCLLSSKPDAMDLLQDHHGLVSSEGSQPKCYNSELGQTGHSDFLPRVIS